MIKKVIALTVSIVLLIISIFILVKGISINKTMLVPSFATIYQNDIKLKEKISTYNDLVNFKFENKIKELETAKADFILAKSAYEEIKDVNSYEELLELTRDKQYTIEFLWIKLGLIAKNNDLVYDFSIVNSEDGEKQNIDVQLKGDYLAIKNFIYDMLIDLDLQFKPNGLLIVNEGGDVTATFSILDLDILM